LDIQLSEEPVSALADLAQVSIAFLVDRVLDVTVVDAELAGFILTERAMDVPYTKDYDTLEGEGPESWAARFDVSRWGLIVARAGGRWVGGAVMAYGTAGLDMLEGRNDIAVLWDLRVAPDCRGQGVGSRLFQAAEAWAVARGCRHLKVETQNVNVAACRFYARQGCRLGEIHRFAYPALPEETQMLWYKEL
jgi:ribosomal protein S18 acetylase RimI-like enzyme